MTAAEDWLATNTARLIDWRRDLHAHPEVAYVEKRTTNLIERHLLSLGLRPRVLPKGTGLVCDIGTGGPLVALRADIDALPLSDLKDVPYRSQNDGMAHACGHDAHTAILMGAAAVLAELPLAGRVRLIFQPAEEVVPGGANEVIDAGGMDEVASIYALHCDPRLDLGLVGVRTGAITAACDSLDVTLSGPGGHTARPHHTADLVNALGLLITDLPSLLGRRVDSRAGLTMVWGAVSAGSAANAIPTSGWARGTVRMLDHEVWRACEELVRELVAQIVAPTGVEVEIDYVRGVPPVVNTDAEVEVQRVAVVASLGADALAATGQSMGGEDFAWFLERAPGALARLGVRGPGPQRDLHQGAFDLDERALAIGVRYCVELAQTALRVN